MGGSTIEDVTCEFVSRCDVGMSNLDDKKPPSQIDDFLNRQLDVGRSLWDRESLIIHLDIEYVNFDFELEPYLDMGRSFRLQKPVIDAVEKLLQQFGIQPLRLLSGRGPHFVWKVNRHSEPFCRIATLRRLPRHLRNLYQHPVLPLDKRVPEDVAAAFTGLGCLLDYLIFEIKRMASPESEIPVELTANRVGPQQRGREIISIDASEYGDPLYTRMIRMPFTIYHKHWIKMAETADSGIDSLPPLFMIPLYDMKIDQAINVMRDQAKVEELAKHASVNIPDETRAVDNLIEAYENSAVKSFHGWHYAQEADTPENWESIDDQALTLDIPPCVKRILEYPNDSLLKPAEIQVVVRTFLALGWHPRHIAGLIRSRYERDFGWEYMWFIYDADCRADYYTRIFTGIFTTGQDDLVDFNCISLVEKGLCSEEDEPCGLEKYYDSLMNRRKYDRLASRPFNRLFFSDEHL